LSYFEEYYLRLCALSVFRGLRSDPTVAALGDLLAGGGASPAEQADRYARFASLVLAAGGNWTAHLFSRLVRDENPFVRKKAAGEEIPPMLKAAVAAELASLQLLGGLTPADLLPEPLSFPVAGWEVANIDFAAEYRRQLADVARRGYGIFADHHMFLVKGEELSPVLWPDSVEFKQLTGYERERAAVVANTKALIEGRPAANVLLYGDSGTGKSTCVKAVANEFRHLGLRLIELRKDQLAHIPGLIDRLSGNPLKFILFIDDLSFSAGNDQFSALKAILEGSVSARTANMAIYATSNRRHLVRENFADRQGGEVHLRDTLEEISSLSERFGLTVTFLRPDRDLYQAIARNACASFGIPFDGEIAKQAEAFALARGGRSARAAKQFAENLAAQQTTPR